MDMKFSFFHRPVLYYTSSNTLFDNFTNLDSALLDSDWEGDKTGLCPALDVFSALLGKCCYPSYAMLWSPHVLLDIVSHMMLFLKSIYMQQLMQNGSARLLFASCSTLQFILRYLKVDYTSLCWHSLLLAQGLVDSTLMWLSRRVHSQEYCC